jgi:drug/metabolite transporter (DMT)-like permease
MSDSGQATSSQPGRKVTRDALMVNVAVVLFGLAGVLGKMTALPAPLIVFGRVVVAGAALGVVALRLGVRLRPHHPRDALALSGQGLLLAVHWVAFFQSINVSSVAIGLLSFSSFPLFTALFEPTLLRQRLRRAELAGALLVLPGIYLLAPSISLTNATTQGVVWGVLAGATFALLSVGNRWLGRRYSSIGISLYQEVVAALALLPALWLIPLVAPLSPSQALLLITLGLVCTALAHTLFIAGLRSVTAQLASLLACLEPVWGILFALILLRETPTPRTLVGGAVILAATIIPAATIFWSRMRGPPNTPNTPNAGGRPFL